MKIASVTENGNTISQHFGRAPLYVVVTAEDGKVLSRETRAKAGHHDFHQAETKADECGCGVHGHGEGADAKHRTMADSIADCSVVMAGGMGWGANERQKSSQRMRTLRPRRLSPQRRIFSHAKLAVPTAASTVRNAAASGWGIALAANLIRTMQGSQ